MNQLTVVYDSRRVTAEDWQMAMDRFASQAHGFDRGRGKTVGFVRVFRLDQGQPLWENMTPAEQKLSLLTWIKRDLDIVSRDIVGRNVVDYLLDRALDPLDPLSGFYKLLLKSAGATLNGPQIRLSPALVAIFHSGIVLPTSLDPIRMLIEDASYLLPDLFSSAD